MTEISSLICLVALIGFALICLFASLLRQQKNRSFWLHSRHAMAGMSLLLLMLSACGGGTTSQPPTVTPLALTSTPQLSTTPALSATDWTTYHRDNQRTGYIASTPDPQSLSKLWGKQLDGAVYA